MDFNEVVEGATVYLPEYKVSELADRNAGVVLKIRKDRLQSLK